jgi:hypothetical protein
MYGIVPESSYIAVVQYQTVINDAVVDSRQDIYSGFFVFFGRIHVYLHQSKALTALM